MLDSYVIKDQHGMYFLTFQVVAWVDIFTRKRYKDIVVDAFNFCIQHKGLQVHSWCIMSNHVHCILSSKTGELSNTIRDLKRHTSKTILQSIQNEPESRRDWMFFQFKKAAQQHVRNNEYQLWTHENHAIGIDLHISDMFLSKLHYIHNNPVREGYVDNATDYLYSSARDYAYIKGLVQVAVV
jgi:REP element-mobilizing transposase RayT